MCVSSLVVVSRVCLLSSCDGRASAAVTSVVVECGPLGAWAPGVVACGLSSFCSRVVECVFSSCGEWA